MPKPPRYFEGFAAQSFRNTTIQTLIMMWDKYGYDTPISGDRTRTAKIMR